MVSSKVSRSLAIVAALAVLAAIAYTSKIRFSREEAPPIDPARDFEGATRRVLEQAVLQLESRDRAERESAEQAIERMLIDVEMARRTQVTADGAAFSAADWYASEGASRLLQRLLQRFDGAHDEAAARTGARLLTSLAASHPKATASALEGERLPDFTQHEPWVLAALIANAKSKVAPYAIYRLLDGDRTPGALFALALLRRLERMDGDAEIRAALALLRRVPDRALRRLLAAERQGAANAARPNDAALLADRFGANPEFATVEEWLRVPDAGGARARALGAALASGREDALGHALARLRWDAAPALDGKVLELAAGTAPAATRKAALLALGAIPTAANAGVLERALGTAHLGGACRSVIARWRGAAPVEAGAQALSSGVPLEAADLLAPWQQALAEIAARAAPEAIDRAFGAGTPGLADYTLLELLAARGECDGRWYGAHGARIVRGLEDPDPAIRAATLRALAYWETPAVAPILVRRLGAEEDAVVAHALIDLLLEVGGTDAIPAVLRTLTDGANFHGVELVTTYALVFPDYDLMRPLRELARDGEPARRAGAAYLIAGNPRQNDAESAGELLCALLEDAEELPRFWGHQALVRRYGTRVEYDPRRAAAESADAIARWRDVVRASERARGER